MSTSAHLTNDTDPNSRVESTQVGVCTLSNSTFPSATGGRSPGSGRPMRTGTGIR